MAKKTRMEVLQEKRTVLQAELQRVAGELQFLEDFIGVMQSSSPTAREILEKYLDKVAPIVDVELERQKTIEDYLKQFWHHQHHQQQPYCPPMPLVQRANNHPH